MAIKFTASDQQYTGTLPATIPRPFTIVAWIASTNYAVGTYRWGAQFAGANTLKIGSYSAGAAYSRPGQDFSNVVDRYNAALAPLVLVCYDDSGNSQFIGYDYTNDPVFSLAGGSFTIGTAVTLNSSNFYGVDSAIGKLAIWGTSIGLDATFRSQIFTRRANPLAIRPADLHHYWPLIGGLATEPDLVGGATLTRVNSPDAIASTGQNYRKRLFFGVPAAGSDITAPTVSSATISVDGDETTVVFDEAVTGDGTGFVFDDASALTYVSGDGTDTWVFSHRVILASETRTLEYDDATGDMADDPAGNVLASFAAQAVTNDSEAVADETAPDLTSATVISATLIRLVFNEPVTLSDLTGWSIASSGAAITPDSFTGDSTSTIDVVPSRSISSTESLSISYNAVTGNVEDMAGTPNALESISNLLVTNNVSAAAGAVALIGPGLIL